MAIFTRRKNKQNAGTPSDVTTVPAPHTAAARQLRELAGARARRARNQLLVVTPLVVAVLAAYRYRVDLFGVDEPIRIVAAFVLSGLGWWVARDAGRMVAPSLSKRIDVSNAGTLGFLIRLVLLGVTLLVALRIAGLEARSLALGGAFTAVVLGLAAQNTLGNVLSGLMLISARPFRMGERVRLQAGGLAGQVEGTVTGFGLLYVTLARGEDTILVPNSTVLMSAIVPLREPTAVDLRARLEPDDQAERPAATARRERQDANSRRSRTSRSRRSTTRRS